MNNSHGERSSLDWIRRKLASQDLPTLARRLKYAVQRAWTDKVFPTRAMTRHSRLSGTVEDHSLKQRMIARSTPRWHWSEQDVPAIVESISDARRRQTLLDAAQLADRWFTFRGHGPVSLPKGEWAPSDVSRTWIRDFNRHHWYATLGFAYRYGGDRRFVESFLEETSSWMDQHVDRLGRIWWDAPFEVASRLNAWAWAHFLFIGSPDWRPAHYARFMRAFGLMAEYLHQTIEYHSLGNHIFLEAKALTLCGELFPEFAGAARWRKKGWRILNGEIRSQVTSDGVHAEGSAMYHRIVAGELAELWRLCVLNDHPEADPLQAPVEKMAVFQRWINQGHGHLPLFGDAQLLDTYYRFSAPVIMGARSQVRVDYRVEESSGHNCWALGGEFESQPRPGDRKRPAARAFPQGGYFVTRSDWSDEADVLVWDCGPVGYKQNRKHAHLDALSFTLSLSGTPLLIDPGVHEGKHEGIPLRSTRAHNTVSIDGEEQGILAPRGEIWSPPISKLLLWAACDECVVMAGQHDGYTRLTAPVLHTRHVFVMHGSYWLTADCVHGEGEHLVEQRFHVVPGAQAILDSNGQFATLRQDDDLLRMSWASSGSDSNIRLEPSVAEPYCGKPEPSCMISAEVRANVPISLAVACSRGNIRLRRSDDPGLPGWLIVSGDSFEHFVFAGSGLGVAAPLPDGWATDAQFAVMWMAPGGANRELRVPRSARVWRSNEGPPTATGAEESQGLTKIVLS